jgi:hypothetical protein
MMGPHGTRNPRDRPSLPQLFPTAERRPSGRATSMLGITPVDSHPYRDVLDSYRELELPEGSFERTAYLDLIDGVVRCFKADQDDTGAIIDRYTGRERHYSTPAYALGAALLVACGADDLLPSAEAALVHSAEILAAGAAADGHPDFYTVFLVAADRLLECVTTTHGQRDRWEAALRRLDPAAVYRSQAVFVSDADEWDAINWNAISLTGEYLRYRAGYSDNTSWCETHLPHHLRRFSAQGLYRDGLLSGTSHPFAYDAVSRYTLGVLLGTGYDGAHAGTLERHLVNGVLTSLLVQAPTGEWLSAGRSSHHVWNEAALAAAYEWAAVVLHPHMPEFAASCRRGAQLALTTIEPWRRAGGDLNIVRNRCEPEERHGYEQYSNHTTYNLWTVGALAYAFLLADDSIPTRPLPSEVASYAVDLGEDMHQVIVANRGFAIAVDTWGDPATNPTGLLRIGRAGHNAQIGPSDGAVTEPRFSMLGKTGALTHAPAWRDRLGNWHSLAQYGADSAEGPRPLCRVETVDAGVVISWYLASNGCRTIRATYLVNPDQVDVSYTITGNISGLRAEIPLFVGDGAQEARIEANPHEIIVRFGGSEEVITSSSPFHLTRDQYAIRTGWLRRAYAESASQTVALTIRLALPEQ